MDSDLEKLKKGLYREGEFLQKRLKRDGLSPSKREVKSFWKSTPRARKDLRQTIETLRRPKKNYGLWILILFLLLLVSAGSAFYFVGKGLGLFGNVVSSKNIDLEIQGPSSIEAGVVGKWFISISNNNKVGLELADLIINYPTNTFSSKSEEIDKERHAIGEILPDESVKHEIDFFLLGEEESQKEIEVILEYRLKESNAIFAKSQKHIIQLSRSPVGISLKMPEEIESGQLMTLEVEYVSNSNIVLNDLYLQMEYPPGFQFKDANFEAATSNNTWHVGDLRPQEKRMLKITGILEGQDLTGLSFKAIVGFLDAGGELNVLNYISELVLLKRPFLNFNFLIDGRDVDVVSISKSSNLVVTMPWRNNLPAEVGNVTIEVKLKSEAIDFKTLSVTKGFYRAYDNAIVWNSSSLPELVSVASGSEGSVRFSFSLKNILPVNSVEDKNFTIIMEGDMRGNKTGSVGQSSEVKSTIKKEIKVASVAQLASRVLYSSGPFSNSGPIPPEVGKETTYTVIWSISNFYNDISNAVVRASLPAYIRWVGLVEPSDENIIYNPSSGDISWHVGKVESATGILRPVKEVAFQIAFLPSLNQINDAPLLLSESSLEATDTFTDLLLRDIKGVLSTASISEVQSNSTLGRVTE